MASPLTRQDLVAITDGAKNNIIQRLVTKYDVQNAADNARDRILNTINAFHVESQTMLRQNNSHNDQMWRRMATVEAQITALRQDVRLMTQAVNRLYEVQTQQQVPRQRSPELDPFGA
jgi:protocatechuate 3,4-dioxygenase beta subunit